jgi:hypothetical protein
MFNYRAHKYLIMDKIYRDISIDINFNIDLIIQYMMNIAIYHYRRLLFLFINLFNY